MKKSRRIHQQTVQNSQDPVLVQEDLPVAIMGAEGGNRGEVPDGPKIGDSVISILGRGGNIAAPPDEEMQAASVNKVDPDHNNEKEVEALQALALLELIVFR